MDVKLNLTSPDPMRNQLNTMYMESLGTLSIQKSELFPPCFMGALINGLVRSRRLGRVHLDSVLRGSWCPFWNLPSAANSKTLGYLVQKKCERTACLHTYLSGQ